MIELVFQNATAGSMRQAKKEGFMEGSPEDVAVACIMADKGNIVDIENGETRDEIYRGLVCENEYRGERLQAFLNQHKASIRATAERLRDAIRLGEAVRIWWSESPEETCGFYWAVSILEDSEGPVTSIKLPHHTEILPHGAIYYESTGGMVPKKCHTFLKLERTLEKGERIAVSGAWKMLARQNTPLRAVINGQLQSVPENFYDYVLYNAIPEGKCSVIDLLGEAMGNGYANVGSFWFARRIRAMIDMGVLDMVERDERFSRSIVKRKQSK